MRADRPEPNVVKRTGYVRAALVGAGVLCLVVVAVLVRTPATTAPTPPTGMIYVPGGTSRIGSDDGPIEERPTFEAEVRPFFMDVHPVTVAQFRTFVEATGHRTDAER